MQEWSPNYSSNFVSFVYRVVYASSIFKFCIKGYRQNCFLYLLNGIDGNVYNSFKSILANSESCIRINNRLTDWFSSSTGAKQDDSSSPTLFAIFINDLVKRNKWPWHWSPSWWQKSVITFICRWHSFYSNFGRWHSYIMIIFMQSNLGLHCSQPETYEPFHEKTNIVDSV